MYDQELTKFPLLQCSFHLTIFELQRNLIECSRLK